MGNFFKRKNYQKFEFIEKYENIIFTINVYIIYAPFLCKYRNYEQQSLCFSASNHQYEN